jgi:hypothetical protein
VGGVGVGAGVREPSSSSSDVRPLERAGAGVGITPTQPSHMIFENVQPLLGMSRLSPSKFTQNSKALTTDEPSVRPFR